MAEQTFTDWYAVLGVPRDASLPTIKRAYRKLAKQFHPDTSSEPDAEARFKLIQAAFEILSDPDRRGAYDREWMTADPLSRMDEQMLRDLLTEGASCLRCQDPDYDPDPALPGICSGCKTDDDEAIVEQWAGAHGADLLDRIREYLKLHFVLPRDEFFDVWAMFALHTHVFEARRHCLYMTCMSPTKGCGKSAFLEVLSHVCHEGQVDNDPVAIAMAENIASSRPTLLVDEIDGVWQGAGRDKQQLRRIFNVGFTKHTGFITRRRKGGTQRINVFCPKVIGGQEDFSIPATIRDRAIQTTIHKATKEELDGLKEITISTAAEGVLLQSWAAMWANVHMNAVAHHRPKRNNDAIYAREWDKWSLIFTIAELVGGHWPDTANAAAEALSEEEDEDPKITLLRDVRTIFTEKKLAWVESQAIADALNNMEDREWFDYGGRGVTTHSLARLLRSWGVKPMLHGPSKAQRGKRGYNREAFTNLWERYL